jgi:WD40 repeat protein
MLVSASADQTVRLWRTEDWSTAPVLIGHTDEVWSARFSPDGKQIVSACKDGAIFVWEEPRGQPRNSGTKVLPVVNHDYLDVSPDGKTFVTIDNGVVHLITDTDTAHEELGTNNVAAFWVAPDEIVLGVKHPPQLKVWNVKGNDAATFPLKSNAGYGWFGYLAASRIVVAAVYNPAEKTTTVTRLDVATRRELTSVIADVGPTGGMNYRVSQDGRSMVRFDAIGSVRMLDLVTGEAGEAFTVRKAPIQGLALSPDGKSFVSAGFDSPEINVWDVATRKLQASLHGHNLVVRNLAYSPDGQRMISSSIGSEAIKVWEPNGWQQVSRLSGWPGTSLSLASMLSDGNTIAAQELELRTGNRRMRVWQSASWEEINAAEAKHQLEHITQ